MNENARGNVNLPIEAAKEALTVRRVFGEAYTSDGATVIPVAKVFGGSGMGFGGGSGGGWEHTGADGGKPAAEGSGGGGGFGVRAKPVGVYVVRDGHVHWRPALDLNRVILGGQVLGAVVVLSVACVLRARSRRG